jgi:tRNA-specific 2-thiouridylase
MLYMLGQQRLQRLLFPLGELTKAEVRAEAERLGLPVAYKPDSQEICFVGKDYRDFLARHLPERIEPGELVDTAGQIVGRHRGLALYTIGQRSGLNLARPERSYVVAMQSESNRIVVGQEPDLLRAAVRVRQPAFNLEPPSPERAFAAKIRSHGGLAPCRLERHGEYVDVRLEEPQRAVSPGQVIVFYDGEVVVGGGIID